MGEKASVPVAPFTKEGVIGRKDTLFHEKVLWNSEYMQGSSETPVTGRHPELGGGQGKRCGKAAGLGIYSKALNVHWTSTWCRKWECKLSLEGRSVKNCLVAHWGR